MMFKKTQCIFVLIMMLILVSSCQLNQQANTAKNNALTGNNWKVTSLPEAPSLRASAVSDGSLWVAGTNSKIFKSLDQGTTWLDVSLTDGFIGDIRDIEVFDSKTAIIMSVGEGELSRLYQTSDGGQHWQRLLTNRDKQGFFDSIAFWNRQDGLLLGDPVDGFYVVLKTNDGGKNWRRIPSQQLPAIIEKESAFAASGNTLIVQPDVGSQLSTRNNKAWITTGGFSASVYQSDDSGESWNRFTVPIHNTTQTSGGYALALNHQNNPFVLGGDYLDRPGKYANVAKQVTRDGQKQWEAVETHQGGLRTAMSCIQLTCLMTGKTSTDQSSDGGHTWRAFSEQGFYTLASKNGLFLAAGDSGRVGILKLNNQ